jgi:hypothetical protein
MLYFLEFEISFLFMKFSSLLPYSLCPDLQTYAGGNTLSVVGFCDVSNHCMEAAVGITWYSLSLLLLKSSKFKTNVILLINTYSTRHCK